MTEVIVAILMATVTVGVALFGWLRARDSARFDVIEKNAVAELVSRQTLADDLKRVQDETRLARAETDACLKERQIIVGQLAIGDRKLLQQDARIRELEQKIVQLEKGVSASGIHLGGEP